MNGSQSITPQTRRLLAALAVLALLLLGGAVVYRPWQPGAKTDEELVDLALASQDGVQKNQAAAELIGRGRKTIPQIRRLYQESSDPAVKAVCVQGMGRLYDYESMDSLLLAMEDDSPLVRSRAHRAVVRLIGLDAHFNPHAPTHERLRVIEFYRNQWKQLRDSGALREFEQTVDLRYGGSP